ncbi:MAG: GcrA family cell cycle regulator [Alphaproteobacteria bacterium]
MRDLSDPDRLAPIPPTPRWPAGSAEALIRLWRAGLPTAEIGARLGVTARAIDSKVRKLRTAGYALPARRTASAPRARRARRSCLYCGRPFASSHIGNRLCPACLEDGPFGSAFA